MEHQWNGRPTWINSGNQHSGPAQIGQAARAVFGRSNELQAEVPPVPLGHGVDADGGQTPVPRLPAASA